MNGLTKSEEKTLAYLRQMFPGYAWGKTAGGGQLDFMGAPPPGKDLPMLFVESKCEADRVRDSQNEWAKSEIGLRCRKFMVYSPSGDETAPCFLYTWDDFLTFVEGEDALERDLRKTAERRASAEMAPGEYFIKKASGADATMRIGEDGTYTVLAGSRFRLNELSAIPQAASSVRQELKDNGKLVRDGEGWRLTEDTEFTSASAAASAVNACSASGPYEWKKNG